MGASTTEGTGLGSVERYFPRPNTYLIRAKDIVDLQQVIKEVPPDRIDGGQLSFMVQTLGDDNFKDAILKLTKDEMSVILQAAEIIKNSIIKGEQNG